MSYTSSTSPPPAALGSPHSQAASPNPLHFEALEDDDAETIAVEALPQTHDAPRHHHYQQRHSKGGRAVPYARHGGNVSPSNQPTTLHKPHTSNATAAPSPQVLSPSAASLDLQDMTDFFTDLLGDAAQFAVARVEAAMSVIGVNIFDSVGDNSLLPQVAAARSLLQVLSELATAATQQRRRSVSTGLPPPATKADLPPPRPSPQAQAILIGKRVSIALPAGVSALSMGPFRSINSPTLDFNASTEASPKPFLSMSPKPFRFGASVRGKRQALCFADSGIFRRQSTAFYDRAELGGEEDDGTFTINQHIVLMQLGRGAQGEVFLAMDGEANELRAIKAIPRPATILANGSDAAPRTALELARDSKRAQLQREIAIMKKCRHRNIVSLYEVIDDPSLDVMYLVMQYVDKGPIATMRSDGTIEKRIEGGVLADYALQIAKGLRYLHRSGIIHRDIKPDNILLGSKGDVYLADFGVSELFDDGGDSSVAGTRGTLAFLAPELFVMNKGESSTKSNSGSETSSHAMISVATTTRSSRSPEVNGEAVDVWALGVTLYTLLFGRVPWRSTTVMDLMVEVTSATVDSITFPFSLLHQSTGTKHWSDGGFLPSPPPPLSQQVHRDAPNPPAFVRGDAVYTLLDDFLTPPAQLCAAPEPLAATRRIDAVEAFVSSEWEQQWSTLLRGMLHPDPAARYTLASVLTALPGIQDALASTSRDEEQPFATPPLAPVTPTLSDSITALARPRRSVFEFVSA